ncbi:MAG: hypothetical protein OFPI_41840 [Osedax symbiont Rs2]|nr:MAG: hypothetical protein OFPI_41840 [Osedax symbiont Rs2]
MGAVGDSQNHHFSSALYCLQVISAADMSLGSGYLLIELFGDFQGPLAISGTYDYIDAGACKTQCQTFSLGACAAENCYFHCSNPLSLKIV